MADQSDEASEDAVTADLVLANHILARQGVVDAFGHVSVRHPARHDHFLLARSMAPALVGSGDILIFDLDGAVLGPAGASVYLERFIHAELYRARPDVVSVVHSHSHAVIPFGVTGERLRPIFHMTAFLGEGVPVFDTRDAVGDSDLLVRDAPLGRALASTLGDAPAVLQRGHGSTVVGASVQEAVFRAIYLETNARLQAGAMLMGPITFLTPGEAALAGAAVVAQVSRAWEAWVRQL